MRLPLVNPDDQTSIDIEQFKLMADKFIERGFTYFDTAFAYPGSEEALGKILEKNNLRDKISLPRRPKRDSFARGRRQALSARGIHCDQQDARVGHQGGG